MSVQAGIIDFALHPPLGLLTPHSDTSGPYAGFSNTITAFSGGTVPVANTFGIYVTSDVIPGPWGIIDGWIGPGSESGDLYEPRFGQVVVQHQLASGLWVTTQMEDLHQTGQLILWETALPGRIGLAIAPQCSAQLYYLRVG